MKFGSKKLIIFATLALMLAALFLGGCGSSSDNKAGGDAKAGADSQAAATKPAKVYNLKIADMSPPTSITAKAFEWWGSEIEKRTNGQVKFQYFWSGSLVGAYEQLPAVKAGNIDVTPYYSAYHPDIAPLPGIGILPLMNIDMKSGIPASDELFRTNAAVQAEFKNNGVKYMFPANTFFGFNISRKKIDSLDDFKGITWRAFGAYLALYKELGANVVSLPLPEVHDALGKGAIDGTFNFLTNMAGNRDWEVAKFLNTTNLGHNIGMPAVMNEKTWNSLPPDVQKVIEEVNKEALDQVIKMGQEFYDRDIKAFKDNGATLTEFSAEDVAALKKIAEEKVWKPYVDGLEKKGIPANDVLNTYVKLIEKYSK